MDALWDTFFKKKFLTTIKKILLTTVKKFSHEYKKFFTFFCFTEYKNEH